MDQVIGIDRFCMKFNIMNLYTYVSCRSQLPIRQRQWTPRGSSLKLGWHWTNPKCRRRKSPISGSLLFHSSGSTERGAQPDNVLHSPWVPKPADPLRCSRSFKLGIMINILPTLLLSFTWMPASTGIAAARPLVKIPKTNCTTKTASSYYAAQFHQSEFPKSSWWKFEVTTLTPHKKKKHGVLNCQLPQSPSLQIQTGKQTDLSWPCQAATKACALLLKDSRNNRFNWN